MLKLSLDQLPALEKELLDLNEVNICDNIHRVRGDIRSTLSGILQKVFYVDQFPGFSTLITVPPADWQCEDSHMQYLSNTVDLYGVNGATLVESLLKLEDISWGKPLKLFFSAKFTKDIKHICDVKPVEEIRMDTLDVLEAFVADIPKCDIPSGYCLSSLIESDAAEVDSVWHHAGLGSKTFIHWMIKNYSSIAVRTRNDKLAAFMIEQENESLGMLYVYPEHRRKGLAQLTISELAHKNRKQPDKVYVYVNNEISKSLHEKCGFKKVADSVVYVVQPK